MPDVSPNPPTISSTPPLRPLSQEADAFNDETFGDGADWDQPDPVSSQAPISHPAMLHGSRISLLPVENSPRLTCLQMNAGDISDLASMTFGKVDVLQEARAQGKKSHFSSPLSPLAPLSLHPMSPPP
jgi:hypothetical protein